MQPTPTGYSTLLHAVKLRVREAQYRALQQVNQQQIQLYWDLGRLIAERQQHGWGKSVVETLARDLQAEFVGMSWFSVSNLWRMRSFYLEYQHDEILAPLVREISWTHNVLIFEKCKTSAERLYYLTQTQRQHWTKVVLKQ